MASQPTITTISIGLAFLATVCPVFAAEVPSSTPSAIVSLIVPPFSMVKPDGEGWELLTYGAIPLTVEVPISTRLGLRLYPQVFMNTGATGDAGVELEDFIALMPWYFSERDADWTFRGGFAGPLIKLSHAPKHDVTTAAVGAAIGYGWQSDGGFFLLVSLALGRFRQLHAGSEAPVPDRIRTALGVILGYRLN